MQQLVLFQMAVEAQSFIIAGKAKLEKQSNLSSNITASKRVFDEDSIEPREFEDEPYFGDIYDEYEDFEVCSHSWC